MIVLKHTILQHQRSVIKAAHEDFQRVSVRRIHLYQDALRDVESALLVSLLLLMMAVLDANSSAF